MTLYDRTWHNKAPGNPGDFLLNSPNGWVVEEPQLRWQGSDQSTLLLGPFSSARNTLRGPLWSTNRSEDIPAAITRATSLIADTIAILPWRLRRQVGGPLRGGGGTTEPQFVPLPLPRWLQDPDLSRPDLRIAGNDGAIQPLDTVTWRSTFITSALWWGDGFAWVGKRGADGQPTPPLMVLHPALVEVVTEAEAVRTQREPGYYVSGEGPFTSREIIHLRGLGPVWNGRGRGVLSSHTSAWEEAAAIREYASSLYTAGVPAGYLKTTTPNMTQAQADDLKAKWIATHGNSRRSIAVLNAATEFVPIQLPPEAAQMIEAKRLSLLDVANAFGIEPFMLGLPSDGATYANIQDRMSHFARFSLLQWTRRVEETFSREFPTGTNVWIDLDTLARANTADRTAYYTAGIEAGWLTPNEVRVIEGYEPLPEPTNAVTPGFQPSESPVLPSEDPHPLA